MQEGRSRYKKEVTSINSEVFWFTTTHCRLFPKSDWPMINRWLYYIGAAQIVDEISKTIKQKVVSSSHLNKFWFGQNQFFKKNWTLYNNLKFWLKGACPTYNISDTSTMVTGASKKLSPCVWRNFRRHLKLLQSFIFSKSWFKMYSAFTKSSYFNDFAEHVALEINRKNNWIVSKTFKY